MVLELFKIAAIVLGLCYKMLLLGNRSHLRRAARALRAVADGSEEPLGVWHCDRCSFAIAETMLLPVVYVLLCPPSAHARRKLWSTFAR